MKMQKHPFLLETVWMDKLKYDEAEKLYYEGLASLAAVMEQPQNLANSVKDLNKVDDSSLVSSTESSSPDGEYKKVIKKQKRKKMSQRVKSQLDQQEIMLLGMREDTIWFKKSQYDAAESMYQKRLASAFHLSPNSDLHNQSRLNDIPQAAACNHSDLVACHHVVKTVWINKQIFDDAECSFMERTLSIPDYLPVESFPVNLPSAERTPDEGYMSGAPTPIMQGFPLTANSNLNAVGLSHPINGLPHFSVCLQELLSGVWIEKPVYDLAEKTFYENLYDGPPSLSSKQVGKKKSKTAKSHETNMEMDLNEAGGSSDIFGDAIGMERSISNIKHKSVKSDSCCNRLPDESVGKKNGSKKVSFEGEKHTQGRSGGSCGALPFSQEDFPSTFQCFLHSDSEYIWLRKSQFDAAEKNFYEAVVDNSSKKASSTSRTPPAARCQMTNTMSTEYLSQEKIWFDKYRYDDAERQYYEQMNGPVSLAVCPKVAQSPVGPAGEQSELVTRIGNLEQENKHLHAVVEDLRLAISKLEIRLTTLEKSPAASGSAPTNLPAPQPKTVPARQNEAKEPAKEEEEEDDDIDLFGSDDEEDTEAARIREERLKQYAEKKSKKPALIAKSSILLDVKPWDDETDMVKLEECVRSVQADGLLWGTSKLVPVGYGIKKLQIQCVVEDDKVGTDMLEEEITKFEEYVQSVDVAAFNKI
ncbi:eukaryotic translation elongation factor 1 delta b (guanine nucleotide exchange protein) isoform X3 [Erpetoichthys calabaricus]|uniref:eukaryotic translation elongation factor 1 delta b (guanine nucleotide exchange protein) isoform X3 n=1 Tax=Erpetoichthys calabaricus TaxID=27687 RepID=UPI0022344893|nr:eukaryotic translation elongation factor 1 delta b (guanine nucleotide exchange protein) isoform X3 [Erpetoichthys calabaricus]